jgi:parallel beta-helix repeat protein
MRRLFITALIFLLIIIIFLFIRSKDNIDLPNDLLVIEDGRILWDEQSKTAEVKIRLKDEGYVIDGFRVAVYFKDNVSFFYFSKDEINYMALDLEKYTGELLSAEIFIIISGREILSKKLFIEKINNDKEDLINPDYNEPKRVGGGGNGGSSSGGGGGGGGSIIPQPPICLNDTDCSSIGSFCDGSIVYNCTLDIEGCLKRNNVELCQEYCYYGECKTGGLESGARISEAGDYYIYNNLTLELDGVCIGVSGDNILIDCLGHQINGGGTNNSAGFYLNGNNITIQNCSVVGMLGGGEGVYSISSNSTRILSSRFLNNSYGVYLLDSGKNEIYGNVFSNEKDFEAWNDSHETVIVLNNFTALNNESKNSVWLFTSNNTIENNSYNGYSNSAITLFYNSVNQIIRHNNISNSKNGIITHGSNILIEGNWIKDVSSVGIALGHGYDGIDSEPNVTVRNNFLANSFIGIFINSGKNSIIEGNYIDNSTERGIDAQADQGNKIFNNTIKNSGIGLNFNHGKNMQIFGNYVFNNSKGMIMYASNFSFIDNKICNNSNMDVSCSFSAYSFYNNQCSSGTWAGCGGTCSSC